MIVIGVRAHKLTQLVADDALTSARGAAYDTRFTIDAGLWHEA
jgi:hypothetical protein